MHISTRLILGGSQENTVLSAEGQVRRGNDVAVVYGPIYGPEGSLLERVRRNGRIDAIETPRLVREVAPLKDWRCAADLRRIIDEWRPDVVHTHSSKAGVLGRRAAWSRRVPCVVHTIHGLAFHPYQNRFKNMIYVAAERAAARWCHRIICVADAMRDQALAARIGRPEQYVTVYSGMEVEPFVEPAWTRQAVRGELGLDPDDFVVGTVARLAELKGHDDLLDAVGPAMTGGRAIKLLWVGDGWWRDRLRRRVTDMGLTDRVVLTGLVAPELIPKFMQAMDVLAHPSYREGLPRAVPQALLSGVPAVVYDVDGAREVVPASPGHGPDEDVGRLVRPGDRDGLRDAILWMMDNPQARREMGCRGREQCRTRFAAETMVERLEEVYAQVLAGNDGAGAGAPVRARVG